MTPDQTEISGSGSVAGNKITRQVRTKDPEVGTCAGFLPFGCEGTHLIISFLKKIKGIKKIYKNIFTYQTLKITIFVQICCLLAYCVALPGHFGYILIKVDLLYLLQGNRNIRPCITGHPVPGSCT